MLGKINYDDINSPAKEQNNLSDTFSCYGKSGGVVCSAEELDEAGLAVGVVAMLLEGSLVEQLEAEGTGEVLGMPLATHGRYTLAWGGREGGREGESGREGGRGRRDSTQPEAVWHPPVTGFWQEAQRVPREAW